MLDRQYNMYSVDTGHFYSNHEKYLHDMNCKYRRERKYIQNKLPKLAKELIQSGYTEDDIKKLENDKTGEVDISESSNDVVSEYLHWTRLIRHKREKAKESKEKLLTLLSNKVNQNELTDGKDHIRSIKEDSVNDTNIISVFDSTLSRIIGIKEDELTNALIIVQVYYFDVFKDISFYGFTYKNEKYIYFTSSAGQIRKKKAVFIKESVWSSIEETVMCGLTIDKINSKAIW